MLLDQEAGAWMSSAFNNTCVSMSATLPSTHYCSLKRGSRAADNCNTGQDLNYVSRFFTYFFKAVTGSIL